jgi:hypothetical protein
LASSKLGPNGPTFTLWEALIRFDNFQFPIQVQGKEFSKQELLACAADILNAGDPASAKAAVGADGLARIKDMCRDAGLFTFPGSIGAARAGYLHEIDYNTPSDHRCRSLKA